MNLLYIPLVALVVMKNEEPPKKKPAEPPKPPKTKRSESAVPQSLVGRASHLAASSIRSSMRLALIGPRSLLGKDSAKQLLSELHASTAQELVQTLGRLKGTSMKVGQLASFIDAGVLPPNIRDMYQSTLASLRDAAPPMETKLVKQVFIREFDALPEEMFSHFSYEPAAAASLGQVHLATLHDGREVAVKIQYPGIETAIRSDLAVATVVKPLMPLLAPGLNADQAIAEIRARVLEECDYLHEASNLESMANNYEGHPFVWIPRPIADRTSHRVLTMERAHGATFDEIKAMDQAHRDRVAEILFRFYYGSLYRYGFTSADPHPGNYMLMPDGRVACFDFGLACHLPSDIRPVMHRGFMALIDGDLDSFFDSGVEMGYIRNPDEIDPARFFEWVAGSLAPIVKDREYTMTRDFIAERTAAMMDMRNPWWPFTRKLNLPPWAILIFRLELGLFAVMAQLNATGNWHRIMLEFYGEGGPSSPLGEAESEWLATRADRQDAPSVPLDEG